MADAGTGTRATWASLAVPCALCLSSGIALGYYAGYANAEARRRAAKEAKRAAVANGSLPACDDDTALALVVRSDLKLTRQQTVSQCAQATLCSYKKLAKRRDPVVKRWEACGNGAELRRVDGEAEMLAMQQAAREAGLQTHTIVLGADKAVMAIGPASKQQRDVVCDKLVASLSG